MKDNIFDFVLSSIFLMSILFVLWGLGNIWFGEPVSRLFGQPYSDVRGVYLTPDHDSISITGTTSNVIFIKNGRSYNGKVYGNQIHFKDGCLYYDDSKTELTTPDDYENMTGFYSLKGIIEGDSISGVRTVQFHEEESYPYPSVSTDF